MGTTVPRAPAGSLAQADLGSTRIPRTQAATLTYPRGRTLTSPPPPTDCTAGEGRECAAGARPTPGGSLMEPVSMEMVAAVRVGRRGRPACATCGASHLDTVEAGQSRPSLRFLPRWMQAGHTQRERQKGLGAVTPGHRPCPACTGMRDPRALGSRHTGAGLCPHGATGKPQRPVLLRSCGPRGVVGQPGRVPMAQPGRTLARPSTRS